MSKPVLTEREHEIAQLLAAGDGIKNIRRKLHICDDTYYRHLQNIRRKLNSKTTIQAIVKYKAIAAGAAL